VKIMWLTTSSSLNLCPSSVSGRRRTLNRSAFWLARSAGSWLSDVGIGCRDRVSW
jgi:hypothetical protein